MRYLILNNRSLLYAFRIVIGCLIVWWSLNFAGDEKKIYAIISVIVVSEPDPDLLRVSVVSRIINTLIGCALGLLFMFIAGINVWSLLTAIVISVLISTSFKNYPASWKLAPVTVAIIVIPAITGHEDYHLAMQVALERTGEVLYGSLVALLLGLFFNAWKKYWIRTYAAAENKSPDTNP